MNYLGLACYTKGLISVAYQMIIPVAEEILTKKLCAGVMNQQVLCPACFTWPMSSTTTLREGSWPTPTVEVSTQALSAHRLCPQGVNPLKQEQKFRKPVHRKPASSLPTFNENLAQMFLLVQMICSSSCSSVGFVFQVRTVTVEQRWGPCWGREARTAGRSYLSSGRTS